MWRTATPHLDEETVKALFLKAANAIFSERDSIREDYEVVKERLYDTSELEAERIQLQDEMNIVAEMIQQCVNENVRVALDQTEYQKKYDGLADRFDRIKERLEAVRELKQLGMDVYFEEQNIPTPTGKETWRHRTVENILSNEKYKGDAHLQKCYTVDFLSKKRKANEGEVTAGLIQKLVDENATRKLDQHEYRKKYDGYASRYAVLESRMDSLEKERERKGIQYDLFSGFLAGLGETEELPVGFNEKLFHRLVDYATVYPDGRGGHLPQRGGSQHGDLKKAVGRFRGFPDILPAVSLYRKRFNVCV